MKNEEIKIKWVGYELELVTRHATTYNQVVENRNIVDNLEEAVKSVFAAYPKDDIDDVRFSSADIYIRDVYACGEEPLVRKFYTEPKLLRSITWNEWYFKVYKEGNN